MQRFQKIGPRDASDTAALPGAGTNPAEPQIILAGTSRLTTANIVVEGSTAQYQPGSNTIPDLAVLGNSTVEIGWTKGLNPDAFFNTAYYLSHNPDVAAAHVDPLLHYVAYGQAEGRQAFAV